MSQLPSFQVTATPTSAYVGPGEAAPAAPAPVGPVAPPEPTGYENIARQLQQFSNTLTDLMLDQQRKGDQRAMADEAARVARKREEIEQLAAAREGNALEWADLVSKGIVSDSENPWVAVAAKRALAQQSLELIEARMNTELENEFIQDGFGLQTGEDPTTAMTKFLVSRTNPLGLSDDILNNSYYANNFEYRFSELRASAMSKLLELRTGKDRSDILIGIQGGIAKALRPPGEDDFDILNNPVGQIAMIESILSDPTNRAALGNDGVQKATIDYLINQVELGDMTALKILNKARLTSGMLLKDTDYGAAAMEEAENRIARGQRRASNDSFDFQNNAFMDIAKDNATEILFNNPEISNAELYALLGDEEKAIINYDPRDGTLSVAQLSSDGKTSYRSFGVESIRKHQQETSNQERISQLVQAGMSESIAQYTVGRERGTANPALKKNFVDGAKEIENLGRDEEISEEDLSRYQDLYETFRHIRAKHPSDLAHYLNESQTAMFMALELVAQGELSGIPGAPLTGFDNALGFVAQMDERSALPRKKGDNQDVISKDISDVLSGLPTDMAGFIQTATDLMWDSGLGEDGAYTTLMETLRDGLIVKGDGYAFRSSSLTSLNGDGAEIAELLYGEEFRDNIGSYVEEDGPYYEIQQDLMEYVGPNQTLGDIINDVTFTTTDSLTNANGVTVLYKGIQILDPKTHTEFYNAYRAKMERDVSRPGGLETVVGVVTDTLPKSVEKRFVDPISTALSVAATGAEEVVDKAVEAAVPSWLLKRFIKIGTQGLRAIPSLVPPTEEEPENDG